ncbi:MAG TPA: hypothetical protein VHM25_28345 [Polyangiaceae bacterium]|nr:hypothetical protein [Polyangiaceae bacterium]
MSALAISCTTLVLAAGCGGGDSGNPSPSGGAGGDAGEDSQGGKASAGKGGKGGAASGGAPSEEAGAGGMPEAGAGGEGGEGGSIVQPPAQNHSAVSFVTAGVVSKSKNFVLISGLGESLGGTVGSKRSKSLKYTYIPGVIAASSP